MQVIEFQTTPHNGMLMIPPEYVSQWEGKSIRVIILDDETLPQPKTKLKQFQAVALNTHKFQFNRDEANDR